MKAFLGNGDGRRPRLLRGVRRRAHVLRRRLAGGSRVDDVRAERLVWIFGSPRTGSTWVGSIIEEQPRQSLWFEPRVGVLFGNFHQNTRPSHKNRDFIMGEPHRRDWLRSVRTFILEGAAARFPALGKQGHHLFVKEPNGALGAPIIMEAMPDSKMVFLIRDPRDVVASRLDAGRKGNWSLGDSGWNLETPDELDGQIRRLANQYLRSVSAVKGAYDAHPGKKSLLRYEDLREDTFGALTSMYRDLEIQTDDARLRESIERHSWSRIPESDKGAGKFFRKGAFGGYKEDLTPAQIRMVEEVAAPLLSELYGRASSDRSER